MTSVYYRVAVKYFVIGRFNSIMTCAGLSSCSFSPLHCVRLCLLWSYRFFAQLTLWLWSAILFSSRLLARCMLISGPFVPGISKSRARLNRTFRTLRPVLPLALFVRRFLLVRLLPVRGALFCCRFRPVHFASCCGPRCFSSVCPGRSVSRSVLQNRWGPPSRILYGWTSLFCPINAPEVWFKPFWFRLCRLTLYLGFEVLIPEV